MHDAVRGTKHWQSAVHRLLGRGMLRLLLAELGLEQTDDRRNQRQHENRDDHQFEMLLHGRNAAEEVSEQREQCGPREAAQHGERRETAPAHAGNAGDERHEGADEREEATQEHRQRAPLLNHLLGLFDTLRRHRLDFAGFDDAAAEEVADPVVALVADDRRAPHDRQQRDQRQRGDAGLGVGRGEEAGREQQRIAGQEREEHHARLDEDDEENESEGRRHAHGDPTGDRGARVLEQVDEEIDDSHRLCDRSLCESLI